MPFSFGVEITRRFSLKIHSVHSDDLYNSAKFFWNSVKGISSPRQSQQKQELLFVCKKLWNSVLLFVEIPAKISEDSSVSKMFMHLL